MTFSWVLDSGGAGRGAWQGGVIHQFMLWTREHGCYPSVTMGASAGGCAASTSCRPWPVPSPRTAC